MTSAVERQTGKRGESTGRRQEVIDTSAAVFYRLGYESASVNDVAKALGITKGSLYHYVQSKEDLLYAIIREVHVLTRDSLRRAQASEGPALDRLHGYFVGHVRTNIDNLEKSTLVYRDLRHLSTRRRREIVKLRDDIEAFVRQLLADGVTEKSICPLVDARLTSIEMFSTANAIYQWYQPHGPDTPDEVSASVADFVIAAVACGRSASGRCFRHGRAKSSSRLGRSQ
jgi:AcrR family transcriptional regulator